jgi:tetratricopeptide (TPR) repeat protein
MFFAQCLFAKIANTYPTGTGNDHIMKSQRKNIIFIAALTSLTFLLPAIVDVGSSAGNPPASVAPSAGNGGGPSQDSPNLAALSEEFPLYKKALTVFAGGGYEEARGIFEQIVGQQNLPAEILEDAWRKLADCTYSLGSDEDTPSYHKAVEYYNRILAFYPDPRSGNDRIHYRLGKSYEKLKYYQAAAEQFREVVTKYPSSPYMEVVFFGMANVAEKEGRLEYAIDEYRSYLTRNPDGAYAKIASFMIGDCYYRMGRTVNAELWFRGALRKWPGVRDLPRKILRDLGFHTYQMKQYAEAISLFSLYVSLSPQDSDSPYVMYSLGHALAEKDQITSAVKVFRATIDQYPGTREARDSAISMIDLEVERLRTKTKMPAVFLGYDGCCDPLMAYDFFLARHPQGELTEYLLFRKGYTLSKWNRSGEAVHVFDRLLTVNSKGKYSDLGRRYLKMAAALTVSEYEKNNDHLAVADVYFRSYGRHLQVSDDYRTCYRMARSLVELGLYADALVLLKELIPREKEPYRRDNLRLFMAEINRREGRDQEAEAILVGLTEKIDSKNQGLAGRIKRDLASIYFRRGDWDRAVRTYGDIDQAGRSAMTALDYQRYAWALHISRQYGQAFSRYRQAAKMVQDAPGRYPPQLLSEAYIGMGGSLYRENNFSGGLQMYQLARPGLRERRDLWWVDLRIGQGYTRLDNPDLVGKTFDEVKAAATAGDAFAVKMIDAWKDDALWNEKIRGFVQ